MAEQHDRISTPKPIGVGGVLLLVMIGIGTLVLQLVLTWSSIRFALAAAPAVGVSRHSFQSSSDSTFWNLRLRLRQFLYFTFATDVDLHPIYSAACASDELHLLSQSNTGRMRVAANGESVPEIERVVFSYDLQGRLVTKKTVPQQTTDLVSDGKSIQLLKHYPGRVTCQPFINEGRPTVIVRYEPNSDLFQLVEFVDDEWHKTDRFALLPGRFAEAFCFRIQDKNHFIVFSSGHDKILYRVGLVTGTEEQATEFDSRYAGQTAPLNEAQVEEIGWRQYALPRSIQLNFGNRNWGLIGFRVVQGEPSLLFTTNDNYVLKNDSLRSSQRFNSQWWHSCATGTKMPVIFAVESRGTSVGYRVQNAIASDGTNYWCGHSNFDDDRLFFRIDDDKARLIRRMPGRMAWLNYLDGVSFYSATVVTPTLILGLMLLPIVLFRRAKMYSYAHETVPLASIGRRSFARAIDLAIVCLPFLAAVVWHPDFSAWWASLPTDIFSFLLTPNPQATWSDYARLLQSIFLQPIYWSRLSAFFTPPVNLWLIVAGFAILLSQATWQGITGQTIGKWLCGIRVLRVTLRPCGFARSLLRELLLVVDSVGLLSWVPGLLCMVGTSRGQRIGDYLADTVVVRGKCEE